MRAAVFTLLMLSFVNLLAMAALATDSQFYRAWAITLVGQGCYLCGALSGRPPR